MPIIQGIRKHPLDSNKNVRIGVAFPLDEVNLFSGTETFKDQVKHNLINVLLTERGERVYEPHFGVGLRNLIFEPNIDTNVEFQSNEHKLFITISYRFLLDGTDDAIQLNFNNNGV